MRKKIPKKTTKKTTKKIQNKVNVTEEEFLAVLDNISKRLCYKFKFAYHDINDMKQQAAIFALEGLEKYDHSRPLENFLWTHVRNRLFNYKRDNYQRPDKPCLTCPLYNPKNKDGKDCEEFNDKFNCHAYRSWFNRNNNKKGIIQPSYIDNIDPANTKDFVDHISDQQLVDFIEENLPVKYRSTYLKLKHGQKVIKNDKVKLQNFIKKKLIPKYKND